MDSPNSNHTSPHAFPKAPLWDNGYDKMARREELDYHLGWWCLYGLKKYPFREVVIDLGNGQRVLKARMLIALGWILAEHWKKTITDKRVAVVLPPGAGATLTNLSLVWAGKIPVNLNFTSSRDSLLSAFRQTGIHSLITAQAMRDKFPDFPWPTGTIDLVPILKSIPKWKILMYGIRGVLSPTSYIWDNLDLPKHGGNHEAALLFSSGSCGEPKGIVLSHRNIVGNCIQISETALLEGDHTLLGCLPIFHSFGFTVTLWFPLIYPVRVVNLPSPLEFGRIVRAVEEEKITVLVGTQAFLRPYLKKATPEQFASVRFVVAGAEKVPHELFDQYKRVLGKDLLEGYGLTETSPVVSVNLPETEHFQAKYGKGQCYRVGSVGRLFPGMQAAILDPEKGTPLGFNQTGMLYLRGPNIFRTYLDTAQTEHVQQNGWLRTGDLGRIDQDGFLYIDGRLSRFSKIGGEMVPHGVVEEVLIEKLGWQDEEERPLVVMGISHPTKGETLVIMSVRELNLDQVRDLLQQAGLPNLWIPREQVRVEKIPILLAGKLDLKNCQVLLEQEMQKSGKY